MSATKMTQKLEHKNRRAKKRRHKKGSFRLKIIAYTNTQKYVPSTHQNYVRLFLR